MFNKNLPMTRFEPRTPGIGSDCSDTWVTTTAPYHFCSSFSSEAQLEYKIAQIESEAFEPMQLKYSALKFSLSTLNYRLA